MDDKKIGLGVSFGFSRKHKQKTLSKPAVGETIDKDDDDPDYVLALEGKEVKSTKQSKPAVREYVIPLIKRNNWRDDAKNTIEKDINIDSGTACSLEELAAKEIIVETKKYNEDWDDRGKVESSLAIPLLMQNKIPDGFETDDRLDVALRPDEPDSADYDQIPIEHFGMAMLRGMGWNKERGVGKNGKVIAPMEAQLRPKGLGLGADRPNSKSENNSTKSHSTEEKEELELKRNAYCVITSGIHNGLYGTVEGIDEDNARVMLKMTLGGNTVNIMQCSVKVVGKKEYEKFSKYINKQKADAYKEKEILKLENGNNVKDRNKSYKRHAHSDAEEEDGERRSSHSSRKSKKKKYDKDKDKSHKTERNLTKRHHGSGSHSRKYSPQASSDDSVDDDISNPQSHSSWLSNDLRVRVIDKSFHRGKYYKEKVVIVDVPSPGVCVCRTSDNKVISDVHQSALETVVPRDDDAHVAIISGSDKGQIGKIMKKDKERCMALVQLLSDRDIVLRLQYDDICEYVGNVHNREDY